jgi:uncharacterized protein (TIGR02099 family)
LRILKSLLIGVVLLWGLLALLLRAATPLIADYRDELAGILGERLGAPVSIGALQARWYGLGPLIELQDIRIGAPPEAIDVRSATLDIALGGLLGGSPLDALRMTVDGLALTAVREPNGQFHLEGLGPIGAQTGPDRGPPPLPRNLRLVNTRVTWVDRKTGLAPVTIERIAILLDRDGSALRLRARLDTPGGSADLAAWLDGFLTTTDWQGRSYLRLDNLDVARLFAPYLPARYGLNSLQLELETWSHWKDAQPRHTQGRFAIDELQLHPLAGESRPLDLAHASAAFSFSREGEQLRLGVEDLRLQLGEHHWPAGRLALSLGPPQPGGRRLSAAADYLRLEDVIRILQVRLPDAALQGPFEQLQPGGEIRDLRLQASLDPERPDWRASARFDGLQVAPWQGAPGVAGLSGTLHGQREHLTVALDGRDLTLAHPGLFREPLALTRLQGRVDLTELDDGWRMSSTGLAADAPHLSTVSRLRVDHRPPHPLFIDLQTDFRDGDAANAHRYYPVGIMGEKLVAWLDRSIRSGRVTGGSALFHGPVEDFAFEKTRSGSFQVLFDTEDVLLDYREGWPPLEGLAAQVKFHGNQVDILARAGRIYDSRVDTLQARIGSLKPITPLAVQGRLQGPLANNLRVLQEPALRERFGAFAQGLRSDGDSVLDVDFRIPLGSQGDYALDGRLAFAGNTLTLPDWDFRLSDVSGTLGFTLDGLAATGIRARALDAPITVDVLPLADGATRVRAAGDLAVAAIRRQLPDLPLDLASGNADFVIDVDIPPRSAASDSPTMLAIDSPLRGIAIALPAPFGKPADTARRLAVRIPLSGRPTPGSLTYADNVSARFSPDGQRVDVQLGGEQARLQPDDGVRIGGRLDDIDLLAWQQTLAALTPGDPDTGLPVQLDLSFGRLRADTIRLKEVRLNATQERGQWRGIVDAPNLAGRFTLPADAEAVPIQVELERLKLSLPLGDVSAETPPVPDPAAGPDPREWPGLVLSIADLRVNDARLGQLRLDAQRGSDGLHLTQLSLRGGALELDSAGRWSHHDGGFETQLGGSIKTDDLGDLLVGLGYTRQLEQAGGGMSFLLQWPGDPAQFHRGTFAGTVTLDIGSGRLIELDPGVTRVVGLLNLNALTRRLRLDFSDIYKKGYSFDSIGGDFAFADGIARADNLAVLGPTGRIDLSGEADLLARRIDQHVTVTPNLDATLPIAGTLAGGPVAGLAVLVAQKVMSKEVDKINRFEYRLQGPCGDPEITQLESGGTLSKILRPLRGRTPEATPAGGEAQTQTEPPPQAGTVGDAAGRNGDTAGRAAEAETETETETEDAGASRNPLRGLLDALRSGESHGADLPGTSQ